MSIENKEIVLIGTGAVAQSFAHRLQALGLAADFIYSRSATNAVHFAKKYEVKSVLADLTQIPKDAFVLLCLPDAALSTFGASVDFKGNVVAHCSGVLPADVLQLQNAHLLSFHPLQSFIVDVPASFEGIPIAIEGEGNKFGFAMAFAKLLGGNPFILSKSDKMKYHLAASIASNFLVTIQSIAQSILKDIDLSPDLLNALLENTLQNVMDKSPQEALTGPIVRGDMETVAKHIAVLKSDYPHLSEFYKVMAKETVHLAMQSGRL